MRLILLALALAAPLQAQLIVTAAPAPRSQSFAAGRDTSSTWRHVRWTILARRGAANSVQAADLSILGPTGALIPWAPDARIVVTPDGKSPGGESPLQLLDERPATKWLTFTFAAESLTTTGRTVVTVDNGAPFAQVVGYSWTTANDLPARDPITWTLDLSRDGVTWVRVDSATVVPPLARGATITRPIFRAQAGSLPAAVTLSCDSAPIGFTVMGASSAATTARTERTTVTRGGACLGVTTLASASRYAAHVRTATGWRTITPTFTSRASAEAAVVAAGGR